MGTSSIRSVCPATRTRNKKKWVRNRHALVMTQAPTWPTPGLTAWGPRGGPGLEACCLETCSGDSYSEVQRRQLTRRRSGATILLIDNILVCNFSSSFGDGRALYVHQTLPRYVGKPTIPYTVHHGSRAT
ncbi:hypothetical protein HaLaN_27239 [Haematococcus lacustris]|uniref:Uncharacterized protein n=1 Tax=Haematococcus lacustris TaxID=44745 RepID=A0A6A0A852_HAELA|nr:hypothetical protein HaLaN_27239 [Haematococcus lacustris]